MVTARSFIAILGVIFHPTYLMINISILSKFNPDPVKCNSDNLDDLKINSSECMEGLDLNAAFGLASSTLSIILQATGSCFCMGLNTILPQAYGAKNYKLCGAYLNRMLIVSTLIFTPILIPLHYVESLLIAI